MKAGDDAWEHEKKKREEDQVILKNLYIFNTLILD